MSLQYIKPGWKWILKGIMSMFKIICDIVGKNFSLSNVLHFCQWIFALLFILYSVSYINSKMAGGIPIDCISRAWTLKLVQIW